MVTSIYESTSLTFLGLVLTIVTAWCLVRRWYFRLVLDARRQVHNLDGENVTGPMPKMLVGNLPDVYRARNRLASYNSFHKEFGDIVQIFWLWRQQISISHYQMARHVLMANQQNYEKFRPNSLLQRLFGNSVLTSEGKAWKCQRLLMNKVFSKKCIKSFHPIFVDYSERLAHKWSQDIDPSGKNARLDIYPDLIALFLDIIGKTSIGKDFGAMDGEFDEFLDALKYIEYQSTQPVHQFVKWWKYLPLPSNRRLKKAFGKIDTFLSRLIHQRQAISEPYASNFLDLLLRATDFVDTELEPLTKKEVRDNLLAIIVNGHQTVATTIALSLYLLAKHPEKMARVQAEVDQIMEQGKGQLTEAGVSQLNYLNCVLLEVLRFSPAVAGLQRISKDRDVLENWSIPPQQLVGIALEPLHRDSTYFGAQPEQFHPERYLNPESYMHNNVYNHGDTDDTRTSSPSKCPFSKLWMSLLETSNNSSHKNATSIQRPLTFGDGARKCLGEHFAMYEMKVALAVLLYHFDFQPAPNFEAELELGKFGLFLSTFLNCGVEMMISPRTH